MVSKRAHLVFVEILLPETSPKRALSASARFPARPPFALGSFLRCNGCFEGMGMQGPVLAVMALNSKLSQF